MGSSFIAANRLWTQQQEEAGAKLVAQLDELDLRQVRVSWGDQHGILRGKTLEVDAFRSALKEGKDFQTATLIFDTTNNPAVPPFEAQGFGDARLTGLPDAVLVPDPTTFRVLPWVDRTGWVLSEMYYRSGERVPFDTRGVLKTQLAKLETEGYSFTTGAELEFYITRLVDPKLTFGDSGWPPAAPEVTALSHGYQYLTENRGDEIDDILSMLRDQIVALGMPLATVEDEWGPGQVEMTFDPLVGIQTADNVLLIRSAIKQICRRHGYHATFMSRPAFPNIVSSGWHLHQSLGAAGQANIFPGDDGKLLSDTAMHYMAGLLEHAKSSSVLTTPTINGYKRYIANSFAPDRIAWAEENRGAMIRISGVRGDDSTHLENRIGEPAANPYLYMASQLISGRDGIARKLDPGPSADEAYTADVPLLPATLEEAVRHFEGSEVMRRELGDAFVNYLTTVKRKEISRFNAYVTDWEQREYFEVF
ncbi:glutamine synthetase family protein [Mycobacterium sp. 21AC1]|uniref:glutamine synthetase family protein n=1 Tax=[Mycobacterium] appelbergii TaxID=2939269 RepID=UPI002938DC0A|nr:glutamine synthetase family protein [Mycobacterium sp. 21AC1]MDV3126039.1 glutamine synthetase family protein [Mycobacterium sp. 21AC1]